ncbi:MAG: UTP--glucose-1-phosphate uridylyltransferase GalU [Methanobrevibacter sp.]|nr:UTP--glucose-1-phosphate uridylyltransferase GalU [Methanobrevibacter sp.]
MKAVIPAAGLGTRFLPATKAQPKEMLPVYDKPTIQYVIEEALDSGIDDILIVTGRNKRSIEDHFDKSYELEYTLQKAGKDRVLKQVRGITGLADICYVRQRDIKGLGDAILCAQKHIGDEPFAVLLGDSITSSKTPCIKQLMNVFETYQKSTIALKLIPDEKIPKYGIVNGEKISSNILKLGQLIEKPAIDEAPTNLAITGRYILTPDIFDKLKETKMGVGNELHLTDALANLDEVYGVIFEGKSFSMDDRVEWLKTSIRFALDDDEFSDDLMEYIGEVVNKNI